MTLIRFHPHKDRIKEGHLLCMRRVSRRSELPVLVLVRSGTTIECVGSRNSPPWRCPPARSDRRVPRPPKPNSASLKKVLATAADRQIRCREHPFLSRNAPPHSYTTGVCLFCSAALIPSSSQLSHPSTTSTMSVTLRQTGLRGGASLRNTVARRAPAPSTVPKRNVTRMCGFLALVDKDIAIPLVRPTEPLVVVAPPLCAVIPRCAVVAGRHFAFSATAGTRKAKLGVCRRRGVLSDAYARL